MSNAEEVAFIEEIDAAFPFEDLEEARRVVSRGAALSDNAALMVGYELASAHPDVSVSNRLSLLAQLSGERPSQLVLAAEPVIEALVRGQAPRSNAARSLLEACRSTPGAHNALNLVADCSPELSVAAEAVRASWVE